MMGPVDAGIKKNFRLRGSCRKQNVASRQKEGLEEII
jgi:hypothetical protein